MAAMEVPPPFLVLEALSTAFSVHPATSEGARSAALELGVKASTQQHRFWGVLDGLASFGFS